MKMQISITLGEEMTTYKYKVFYISTLIEMISVFVIILNITKRTSILVKLLFLFAIYMTINHLLFSNNLLSDLGASMWWVLIFLLFYYISYNDSKDEILKLFMKIYPIFFICTLYFFSQMFEARKLINELKELKGETNLNLSTSLIFYVALLLPFAILIKNKLIKYLFMFFFLITAIFSAKRSVLIYVPICILISIYWDFIARKGRKRWRGIIISTMLVIVAIFVFNYLDDLNGGYYKMRFEMLNEDKGSGRGDMLPIVIDTYYNKPVVNIFIGSGFNGVFRDNVITTKAESLSAHNDFVEILYDFGVFGFFIYIAITFLLFKRLFKLKKIDTPLFAANCAAYTIFFVMSMVSHLFLYPSYFAFIVILWGITEGKLVRHKMVVTI